MEIFYARTLHGPGMVGNRVKKEGLGGFLFAVKKKRKKEKNMGTLLLPAKQENVFPLPPLRVHVEQ